MKLLIRLTYPFAMFASIVFIANAIAYMIVAATCIVVSLHINGINQALIVNMGLLMALGGLLLLTISVFFYELKMAGKRLGL